MTFRWSFVHRSTEGENGKVRRRRGRRTDKGAKGDRGDRLFYGNILVGHTVCAEEEDEVGAEVV